MKYAYFISVDLASFDISWEFLQACLRHKVNTVSELIMLEASIALSA
jgi:hypothetical protein